MARAQPTPMCRPCTALALRERGLSPTVDAAFFRVEVDADHDYWYPAGLELLVVVAINNLPDGFFRSFIEFEFENVDDLCGADVGIYAPLVGL